MKVKIADIEAKLAYKLKRNFTTIGFDTATTTGVCLLKTDNEYLYIDPIVLSFKTDDDKEKYNSVVKMFEKIIDKDMYVIVENVFYQYNPDVTIYLARLGGFAISIAIRKGLDYETILASTARSKFKIDTRSKEYKAKYGKGKSKEAVRDWVVNLGVDIKDNNAVDAFVLALCGLCEGMDFRSQASIQKEKKKSKKKAKAKTKKRT